MPPHSLRLSFLCSHCQSYRFVFQSRAELESLCPQRTINEKEFVLLSGYMVKHLIYSVESSRGTTAMENRVRISTIHLPLCHPLFRIIQPSPFSPQTFICLSSSLLLPLSILYLMLHDLLYWLLFANFHFKAPVWYLFSPTYHLLCLVESERSIVLY